MSDLDLHPAFLIANHRNSGRAKATCPCGYTAIWQIDDGSAEADVHYHRMGHDAEYAAACNQQVRDFVAEQQARGCTCEFIDGSTSRVLDLQCPLHKLSPPRYSWACSHECTCFLSAPCGKCENCQHPDETDCENDCQTCTEHEGH